MSLGVKSLPACEVNFHKIIGFSFPIDAHLHAINDARTLFAFYTPPTTIDSEHKSNDINETINNNDNSNIITSDDELKYEVNIYRHNETDKYIITPSFESKINDLHWITIYNNKIQNNNNNNNNIEYMLVIGFENGNIICVNYNGEIIFEQNLSKPYPILTISLHFNNYYWTYAPSLIINCKKYLLFVNSDDIYRTLSIKSREQLKDINKNDKNTNVDNILLTLWQPKKISLTQMPSYINDIISVPQIDLIKHGITPLLLDPKPELQLYHSKK